MVRRFTSWQILRYPLVFGSCLGAYFTAFSFRKLYFKSAIEEQREKNLLQSQELMAKIENAKQDVFMTQGQTAQMSLTNIGLK